MKLYDRTIEDLKKAIEVEKQFLESLHTQVKEMKAIVAEEQTQRDEFKGLQTL